MTDKVGSRSIVNLNSLLAIINSESPTGPYLKYDPIYGQIREARREEDSSLSQGIWQTDFKKADWVLVEKLCLDVLINQSKDLQVISWLIESWTVQDHFSGLEKGLSILQELCEKYWDEIHPTLQEDQENLEQRISLFDWTDSQLTNRVMFIPFTFVPTDLTLSNFNLADWLSANSLEILAKRSADAKAFLNQAESKGQVVLSRFRKSLELTNISYLETLLQQILSVQQKLESFCQFLYSRIGSQAPNFGKLKKNIEEIVRIVKTNYEQKYQQQIAEAEKVSAIKEENDDSNSIIPSSKEGNLSPSTTNSDVVTISERQDAYRALEDISIFLKSLDAHSPAPYLLELIVSWENKTLIEILADINKGDKEGHVLLKLIAGALQTPSVKTG